MLKAYAIARRFRLSEAPPAVAREGGMEALQDYFSLGVNYVHSVVNRHRVELYLLDANARVAASFVRLEWDEEEVLDEVKRLVEEPLNKQLSVSFGKITTVTDADCAVDDTEW